MPVEGDLIHGKYRLTKELGRGGMGMVFLAVNETIGKQVAIKLLLKDYAQHEQMLARFQQEARAASSVGHRNIIDVHDLGVTDEGEPFIVMELLEGQSLAERLEEDEPLTIEEVAYITCNVLSALSAAHSAGIVHRDLKPDNIFLVDTGAALGEVKLLDFGISRVMDDDNALTRMTSTGMVLGTPHYMSPEQASGERDIDFRTDIYSMGVILYECLTRHLPFNGDNYNAMIVQIITNEPTEPSFFLPDLDKDLEALVLKAMHKERDKRFQSAATMFEFTLPFVAERSLDRIPLPRLSLEPGEPGAAPGKKVSSRPKATGDGQEHRTPATVAPGNRSLSDDSSVAFAQTLGSPSTYIEEPAARLEAAASDQPAPGDDAVASEKPSRRGKLLFGVFVLLVVAAGATFGAFFLSRGDATAANEEPPTVSPTLTTEAQDAAAVVAEEGAPTPTEPLGTDASLEEHVNAVTADAAPSPHTDEQRVTPTEQPESRAGSRRGAHRGRAQHESRNGQDQPEEPTQPEQTPEPRREGTYGQELEREPTNVYGEEL